MLWAVHIPDNIMRPDWLVAGFVGLGFLYWLGAWKIRDEEIPRIALLTAVFLVVSTIHVRLSVSSAHLLLNALVGIMLGRRSGLAISVALLLQVMLFGHGGFTTLGINSCEMTLPALGAWLAFRGLHRLPWITRPWCRSLLVSAAVLAGILSLTYSCLLLIGNLLVRTEDIDPSLANDFLLNPLVLSGIALLTALLTWLEVRMENCARVPDRTSDRRSDRAGHGRAQLFDLDLGRGINGRARATLDPRSPHSLRGDRGHRAGLCGRLLDACEA